jgi:hypothetical protein
MRPDEDNGLARLTQVNPGYLGTLQGSSFNWNILTEQASNQEEFR